MPRRPRRLHEGIPVHHVLRGNNRGAIFTTECDRRLYRDLLVEGADRFDCRVHAYVFMSNHTHLLLTPGAPHAISALTQWLGRK